MSVQNFSFLACIVAEWGWGGLALTTLSNLNPSCIQLELGLGFDNRNKPRLITLNLSLIGSIVRLESRLISDGYL